MSSHSFLFRHSGARWSTKCEHGNPESSSMSRKSFRTLNGPGMTPRVAAGVLTLMALAGGAAACPKAAVHPETARLVQMGAGGQASAKAYEARISGPQTACTDDAGMTRVALTFAVQAGLGPNVEAKPVKAPYFVVVMSAGKIVAKEIFPVTLPFASGAATVSISETVDKIALPLQKGGMPDYELLVGFQLTPEQLRAAQN